MAAFGVRDVCDVVLKSLRNIPACRSITGKDISRGEPVVRFDSLKVSTLSGTSTTVYATGGSGNQRRMAWDGDREVLFHIEDALLTTESFALMSGAKIRQHEVLTKELAIAPSMITTDGIDTFVDFGFSSKEKALFVEVVSIENQNNVVLDLVVNPLSYDRGSGVLTVHGDHSVGSDALTKMTYRVANVSQITVHDANTHTAEAGTIELKFTPVVDHNYPMFIYPIMDNGDRGPKIAATIAPNASGEGSILSSVEFVAGKQYLIDTYRKATGSADRMVLTADATSDYYKLEGSTVFYREVDGEPLPAHLTIFKVKPRTTFELAMNPTGDPAAFSIDFDAFPQKNVPGFEKCKNGILLTLDIETEIDEEDCDCTWEA